MKQTTDSLQADLLAGLVVFFVAVPLCLGIALASGAPLFAGLITGIIGGIVVGLLSKSHIGVAGPAAGLTAVVLSAITTLGSFETFLLAVFLAGLMQLALGFARAGSLSSYFPSNVIEGMLTGIGIIIIIKQLPYATGWGGGSVHSGALLITAVSLAIMTAWNQAPAWLKKLKVPGALVAVVVGVLLNEGLKAAGSTWALGHEHLVRLPVPESFSSFFGQLMFPHFSAISDPRVWIVAVTIAAVASIETLLCVEASDKLDPLKRYTDTNAELKAQGVGNVLCGLLGGLPMTAVIVRTSANVNAGGRTKVATIAHGFYLLAAVLAIPALMNKIPLACLAAVLLMVGYKLAGPVVFRRMWSAGKFQYVPFIVTVLGVVFIDLLSGVAVGLAVSVLAILKGNMDFAYHLKKEEHHEGETTYIDLAPEVSFLNKAAIKRVLVDLPKLSRVVIDASRTVYIDYDVLELIREFRAGSADKGIEVRLLGFKNAYKMDDSSHVHTRSANPVGQAVLDGRPGAAK